MDNQELPIVAATRDGFSRYADFSGISTRSQYWYFVLTTSIITFIISAIAGELVGNVVSLLTVIPTIAVAIRRMHDVGKSGWFILIPVYNFILLITPSTNPR